MLTRMDICNLESRDDGKRRERALGWVVNQPGGPEKSARIAKLYSLTNIIPDFPSDSAASKAIRGLKHGSQARGVLSTFTSSHTHSHSRFVLSHILHATASHHVDKLQLWEGNLFPNI